MDKGKARAIDADVHAAEQPTIQLVKPQLIPSTSLLSIEYPGILSDDAGPSSPSSYSSLERALSTLHPSTLPPFTSSSHEALRFLSRIPNEGLKTVECRLGCFGSPTSSVSGNDENLDQLFKTPLMGEAVPTHNIVIRVVKRTWRQKKRKRTESASPAPQDGNLAHPEDMALDPALFNDDGKDDARNVGGQQEQRNGFDESNGKRNRYTGRVKKEYCVEVLGMATKTVRFRGMADFAFRPDVHTASTSSANPDTPNQLDPVMALHKALATMDLQAFQNFRVPDQLEDYQLPSTTPSAPPKSNLHMLPPYFFSRMEVPFQYNFQQTPYSELRTVATPAHLTKTSGSGVSFAHALSRSDLPSGSMQRFVNRVRLPNITPQPFRVGRDTVVPTQPLPDVIRIEHRCEPSLVTRLRQLLEQRPVWSRVALKNQLTPSELRELDGNSEKIYYALVGYSMVGGPWRDTIVRFGYDVRADRECRFYQRVFLRGGPMLREPKLAHTSEKVDEEEPPPPPPRSSNVGLASAARSTSTHLFDGVSLHRNVGNFQLCDIQDPLIRPYIWRSDDHDSPATEPMATPWLRSEMDAETGWYTRRALDLIRALIAARFKALFETGMPLESQAVERIVSRTRQKWREEDAGATANGEAAVEAGNEVEAENPDGDQDGRMQIDPSLM